MIGLDLGSPALAVRSGVDPIPAWLLRDENGDPPLMQVEPGRYWFAGAVYPTFADWSAAVATLTVSVSANGTRRDATGARVQAMTNVLRLDHDGAGTPLGWLLEGASNNQFLNAASPATQTVTGAGNRTNVWIEGAGSLGVDGPTTATVSEGSPLYYDLPGDVALTPSGAVSRVQVEKNNANRVPSSFIPTAGAPVSRAADVVRLGPNGAGLPFAGFSGSAGTVVAWGRTGRSFNAINQVLLQLDDASQANHLNVVRAAGGTTIGTTLVVGGEARAFPSAAVAGDTDFSIAVAWAANDFAWSLNGAAEATAGAFSVPGFTTLRFNGASDGGDTWAGWLQKFAYFPRRVASLTARPFFAEFPARVHALGDSFVSSGFTSALQSRLGSRVLTGDGVGGSTLSQQLARWTAVPALHDRILVLSDDMAPLSDSAPDIATVLETYGAILSRLRGGRFLILEPGFPVGAVAGSASRIQRDNKWAAIVAAWPDNVVPMTAAMQASGDGSSLDDAYIGAGLWPGSCLNDPGGGPTTMADGHLNAKGNGIYAARAHAVAVAKGWV